jgi:hypothetical protein
MDAYTDLLDKYRFDPEWTYVGRGQNGSLCNILGKFYLFIIKNSYEH